MIDPVCSTVVLRSFYVVLCFEEHPKSSPRTTSGYRREREASPAPVACLLTSGCVILGGLTDNEILERGEQVESSSKLPLSTMVYLACSIQGIEHTYSYLSDVYKTRKNVAVLVMCGPVLRVTCSSTI